MEYDLILRGGTLVTSSVSFTADIAVLNGKIAAIGDLQDADAPEVYDAAGKHILPGIIDAHVHFRDPGITYKEDFETGSAAAAYGGVTTVFDMPNVTPVTATKKDFDDKVNNTTGRSYVDFGFYGLLLDDNFDEMQGMQNAGAVGFKIYLGTSVGNIAAPGDGVMFEQMETVSAMGTRIGFHAENNALNDHFSKRYQDENVVEPGIHPFARPDISEADAVAAAIRFSRYTGAKIHIYHVSAKKSVDLIRQAKIDGIPVTAETCPQYLLFDSEDYSRLGSAMKAFPPIRFEEDRQALWEGIKDRTIDMIATDHAPHTAEEKSGDIWQAMAGVTGVETSVRLMLNEVNKGNLTLSDYVRLASEMPARVWSIFPQKGSLEVGTDADMTIVDMDKTDIIHTEKLHYKNKTCIYDGTTTRGLPVATIVRGTFVMKNGELCGQKDHGRLISPTKE